jgi:hypothetical protein
MMFRRAVVLHQAVAAAAGHFVGDLQSAKGPIYKEVRRFLRRTNLDVVTAEAINWISFLMFLHWQADRRRDNKIFERIGKSYLLVCGPTSPSNNKVEDRFRF